MNRDNDRQTSIILAVLGILPIVWLGLLIAPSVKGGLPEILPSLMNVMSDPFHIELCEDSVKTVLVLLLCYGMGIGIYFSTRRNYRRREEHGSAKWGNAKAVDKKYRQNPPTENKLMTQAVRIGLNGKKHRRNLNTLVCGGSGAGIFGPFFICDCSTPYFGSLNKEQLERYTKQFQNPERFFWVGEEIKAVPYKPEKDHER